MSAHRQFPLRADRHQHAVAGLGCGAVAARPVLCPDRFARCPTDQPIEGRTAILVPIYNEDPVATFSRVAAMDEGLAALGVDDAFRFRHPLRHHLARRSPTSEALWWARLVDERAGRRPDLLSPAHQQYRQEGRQYRGFHAPLGRRLRLCADPRCRQPDGRRDHRRDGAAHGGRPRTRPAADAADDHPRAARSSAAPCSSRRRYFSPVFARGVAMLQGEEGPFWGHNALVRVHAFAESCGLPGSSGKPPFGGHIMSHDYVEAALLARAGWKVRLDPDLVASLRGKPGEPARARQARPALVPGQYAVRQAAVRARICRFWSRLVFAQGIMAYVASPIWLLFLVASIASPFFAPPPDYFPEPHFPFPIFPGRRNDDGGGAGHRHLVPAGAAQADHRGARHLHRRQSQLRRHAARASSRHWREVVFSSLIAPLMLWFQSRAVLQVLLGADGGWSAANRGGGRVSLGDAWQASRWIVLSGVLALGFTIMAAQSMIVWLVPIAGPMVDRAAADLGHLAQRRARLGALFLHDPHRRARRPPVMVVREHILGRMGTGSRRRSQRLSGPGSRLAPRSSGSSGLNLTGGSIRPGVVALGEPDHPAARRRRIARPPQLHRQQLDRAIVGIAVARRHFRGRWDKR